MHKKSSILLLFFLFYLVAFAAVLLWFRMAEQQFYERYELIPPEPRPVGTVPAFNEIESIPERKQAFLDYFEVIAANENARLKYQRRQLLGIASRYASQGQLDELDSALLRELSTQFALEAEALETIDAQLNELRLRVNIVPVALVQVQAAIESGWGTSRFAAEANNYFGQWCFSPGCGIVPDRRPAGSSHEVQRFDSPVDSLRGYLHNLNTFHAYDRFRRLRAELDRNDEISARRLAAGLLAYSERGQAYVDQVRQMIRSNHLE